jgi:hypothetical protein
MKSQDKDFLLFDAMPLWLRLLISLALLSSALFLQLTAGIAGIAASGFLLLFLILINWVRKVQISKEEFSRAKDWQPATIEAFRNALARLGRIKGVVNTATSGIVYIGFVVVLGFLMAPFAETRRFEEMIFIVADAVVVGFVVFSSGNRYVWSPKPFKIKLPLLIFTHDFILQSWPGRYRLEPQFFVQARDDEFLPLDAKLMVHLKENRPDGFYGLQFTLSINTVQNKKYPYFYAVAAARKGYPLKERLAVFLNNSKIAEKDLASLLIAHQEQKGDVQIVILRQHTSRSRGYHTNKRAVRRIIRISLALLDALCD